MNKKIFMLLGVLLLLVGVAGYMYWEDFFPAEKKLSSTVKTFNGSSSSKKPPQQTQTIISGKEILKKTLLNYQKIGMDLFGYKETELKDISGIQFKISTKIKLDDKLLQMVPPQLHHYKNLDFSFYLQLEKAGEKAGNVRIDLNANFLNPITYVYYDSENTNYIYLDKAKELYMFSNDEVKNTVNKKTDNLNINFNNGLNMDKVDIDGLLEKLKIEKLKSDNPDIVKLKVTPIQENKDDNKTEVGNLNTNVKDFTSVYYIDTKKWLINKTEVIPENQENKKPDIMEFQYLNNGFPLKITIVSDNMKVNNKTYKGRLDFMFNYKNSLLSKVVCNFNDKENFTVSFGFNKDKKIDRITFDNVIDNNHIFFELSDLYINKKYQKIDFVIEAGEYTTLGLNDLEQSVSSGEIITKILKDDIAQIVGMFLMPQMNQNQMAQVSKNIPVQVQTEQKNSDTTEKFEKLSEPEKPVPTQKKIEPEVSGKYENKGQEEKTENIVPEQDNQDEETEFSEDDDFEEDYAEEENVETEDIEAEETEETEKINESVEADETETKKEVQNQQVQEKVQEQKTKDKEKITQTNVKSKTENKQKSNNDYRMIIQMYNTDNIDQPKLIKKIENYLTHNPEDVQILYIAAYVNYNNLNNNDKAVDYFNKVLKYADLDDKIEKQLYYWSRRIVNRIKN